MKTISIGKDFSNDPKGRFREDSDSSAEAFREDFLLPALRSLKDFEKLEIIIDEEVNGYGASFLKESFGGIVRDKHFSSKELLSKIKISFSDKEYSFFAERIIFYIENPIL